MKRYDLGSHEALGWVLSGPGHGSHPRARDEVKVFFPGGVKEGHLILGLVVSSHSERNDFQMSQA